MSKYAILWEDERGRLTNRLVQLNTGSLSSDDMNCAAQLDYEQFIELAQIISSGNLPLLYRCYNKTSFIAFEYTGVKRTDRFIESLFVLQICAQAAIEGGADIGDVYALRHTYVKHLYESETTRDMLLYMKDILEGYCSLVLAAKEGNGDPELVKRVNRLIREHLNEKIDDELIAAELGMNPRYVCRKYRELTGITVSKAIAAYKTECARVMLLERGSSIQSISDELGFASLSYFYSVFKENTGVTPGEYRIRYIK